MEVQFNSGMRDRSVSWVEYFEGNRVVVKLEGTMKYELSSDLMGEVVTVLEVYEARHNPLNYEGAKKEWVVKSVSPRAGWVVGVRTIYDGSVYYGGEDDGGYFQPTKGHPCILVAFWPTMNAVRVPQKGFAFGGRPIPPGLDEQARRSLSEVMKEEIKAWKRDEKGRFKGL